MPIKTILPCNNTQWGFSTLPGWSSRSCFCEFLSWVRLRACGLLNRADNAPGVFVALPHSVNLLACQLCSSSSERRSWCCLLARIALVPQTSVGMNHLNNNTGFLSNKASILRIGGYIGLFTAALAYYCGFSELLTPDDIITLPMGRHDARRTP
jgi:hypothetical protein